MSSKLHFRTNVLLKSIIGKDLITDDNIAVLELVKNSFDALSKSVEIVFLNVKRNSDNSGNKPTSHSSKILIQDFGKGMTQSDITDKWLNIAYSEKKSVKKDSGRLLAGNKGVGRFSCDRLGRFLDIYTRTNKSDIIHLSIDWRKFEVEDAIEMEIQDVDIQLDIVKAKDFEKLTGRKIFSHGTLLEISQLRAKWDVDKLVSLRKNLEKLINPNQAFRKDKFDVKIVAKEFLSEDRIAPEHRKVNGLIKNKIFQALNFKATSISAILDKSGKTIKTTLQDRGRRLFTLVENNVSFSALSDIRITLFYLNPYSKAYFKRQTGVRSVDFGSVFLFINGFRIPPYGDEGDDWLGIELRKGQGHSRYLGTREILGRIEINDDSGQFQIISNRSGVVNSSQLKQLTSMSPPHGFFYLVFRRLERFVVEGINWDSVPKEVEKQIEKSIEENKVWNEKNEIYKESKQTRDKRSLGNILKIINAKSSDIIDLKIHEEFIEEVIDEQKETARKEINSVIAAINNGTLSTSQISEILLTLEASNQNLGELKDALGLFDKNSDSQIKKRLVELSALSSKIENQRSQLIELNEQIKRTAEEKAKLEIALSEERKRNTFLLATQKNASPDALGLIHHIKNEIPKIDGQVQTLIDQFVANEYKPTDVIRRLHKIKLFSDKILKISKLITRSNFNEQATTQKVNLPKFIDQYLSLYQDINEGADAIRIEIQGDDYEFITRLSLIDLSIVFDNLITNSIKAGARKIMVTMTRKGKHFHILFSDDGKGLAKRFADDPDEIFKLGETTTDGSGIGLFTVRDLLEKMKAKIAYDDNGAKLKGACFKITFT